MDENKRSRIRYLVKTRDNVQKTRIQMSNRLSKRSDGTDQKVVNDNLSVEDIFDLVDVKESLESIERRLEYKILKELKGVPIYDDFLKDVKGVGTVIAAVIISEIDITKADTVSKIWQYAGLNPGMRYGRKWSSGQGSYETDYLVRGDRVTKGYLSPYNCYLKSKLVKILSDCFIRNNSPYRKIYDDCKQELEVSERLVQGKDIAWKDESKGHRDAYARRKMVKEFLKDLYVKWRTLEGLPVKEPYRKRESA